MSILSPECRLCGKGISFFGSSSDLCEACEGERLRQEVVELKREHLEKEHERFAKAARLVSELNNPIAKLLAKHIDESVQANLIKADSSDTATLVSVTELFFTLQLVRDLKVHVPHSQILHVLEETGKPLVIHIVQLVIYKGGVGIGMSTPV